MPSVYEYSRVCFLVGTWGHFIQVNAGVTGGGDGIVSFSHDNWIARCHLANLSARKWNSSVLLVLSLRKLCQFEGVLLVAVTLLLVAFPCLHLAPAFRLD